MFEHVGGEWRYREGNMPNTFSWHTTQTSKTQIQSEDSITKPQIIPINLKLR